MAETEGFSSRQKVAIRMIALGQDTSAEILKYLNDYEIEDIAQTIAELRTVTTDQEDEVLEEFETLLMAGKYISMGEIDFARGTLEKAMGPRRAQTMLDRVTATTSGGFYLLRNIAPNQIAPSRSSARHRSPACSLLATSKPMTWALKSTPAAASALPTAQGSAPQVFLPSLTRITMPCCVL